MQSGQVVKLMATGGNLEHQLREHENVQLCGSLTAPTLSLLSPLSEKKCILRMNVHYSVMNMRLRFFRKDALFDWQIRF